MNDSMLIAAVALAGLIIVAATLLKAWRDWLELQRLALTGGRDDRRESLSLSAPIELADLKERVRKLEAIAAGVDL